VAAGAALGAMGARKDVMLAGGSQMLAVAALIEALSGRDALMSLAVGTTRWIVEDPAADVLGLAAEISPTLAVLAANLDFSRSRHAALHTYEQFMVKEGVGAGGACVAAHLASGASIEALEAAIDDAYDALLAQPLRTLDGR
jgi:NaMN:DMB phosphoribosyltransferase